MSKKTHLIMGIIMVAMLAFGGTFAYFTATTNGATGEFKTGTVLLGADTMATFVSDRAVHGSKIIDEGKGVKVTTKSDVETYLFIEFKVEFLNADGSALGDNSGITEATIPTGTEAKNHNYGANEYYLDIVMGNGWDSVNNETNVYSRTVEPKDSDNTDAENWAQTFDVCTQITFYGSSASTQDTAGLLMGKLIKLTIKTSSIQKLGLNDANTAWEKLNQE